MYIPIKKIIFDLDDTLIHSNIDYNRIRSIIAQLFNPPIVEIEAKSTAILILLEKLRREHPDLYPIGKKRMIELKIPDILKKFNIESVIFTNNSIETLNLYLSKPRFKFLRGFKIFTRDDFSKPKPDPEGIFQILDKFSFAPECTVYIGDSYIDSKAAYAAGIRFVHFSSREMNLNLFPVPPYSTITSWNEFEDLLTRNSAIRQ
ncbi:MAG: HAD family hydrolase [Candidatus Hodarchaeales archaeon]|jgi:HAD superfamily hydrolase (TIGR01549 family)